LSENIKERHLGKPRHRREDDIEVGYECRLVSSGSQQEPVAGSFQHAKEPFGSIKGTEFLD
jgi:hypothetical protein